MIDVFRAAREAVSSLDVARHYGFAPNRAGFICCPFHNERTPSLKLFPDGGWKCFGCGAGGTSIDFVSRLLELEPLAAVERLNTDFGLGLPLHRKPTPTETQTARRRKEIAEIHRQYEKWSETFIFQLCAACRVAHIALQGIETPEDMKYLGKQELDAIKYQPYFEYLIDILSHGEAGEQMEIFRDRQVIGLRLQEILSSTPTKSGVA